jgi:hypothetical protein
LRKLKKSRLHHDKAKPLSQQAIDLLNKKIILKMLKENDEGCTHNNFLIV